MLNLYEPNAMKLLSNNRQGLFLIQKNRNNQYYLIINYQCCCNYPFHNPIFA